MFNFVELYDFSHRSTMQASDPYQKSQDGWPLDMKTVSSRPVDGKQLYSLEEKYVEGSHNFGEDLKNQFGLIETEDHHRNILQRWRSRTGPSANSRRKDTPSEGTKLSIREGTAEMAAPWNVRQETVEKRSQRMNEGQTASENSVF